MFKKLLIPLEFRSLEKKITIVSKFFFFSSLMFFKCKVVSYISVLRSSIFFLPLLLSRHFIQNYRKQKLHLLLFFYAVEKKLYNFTASKYEMLWIMLFMNHKRPAFCLLCNSRSSTNNKAQMILHRVCPPALIKSPMCT